MRTKTKIAVVSLLAILLLSVAAFNYSFQKQDRSYGQIQPDYTEIDYAPIECFSSDGKTVDLDCEEVYD